MEKELNLYVHFTENEIKFLNEQGVIIHQGEPINIDTAEKIVDELCAADYGVEAVFCCAKGESVQRIVKTVPVERGNCMQRAVKCLPR